MASRNKYLLGAALGALVVGLIAVGATKIAPRMKTRMDAHCREMMTRFAKAEGKESEGDRISRQG